jgi:hypothetical protein
MEDDGRRRARIFLSGFVGIVAAVLAIREAAAPDADILHVLALACGAFVAFFLLFMLLRRRGERDEDG